MAKLCEYCGNKNNIFEGDPLYLENDKILCSKCVKPIKDELNQLFYIKTEKEFDTLTNSIIGKCKTLFNDNITNYIRLVINKRCNNLGFSIEVKGLETMTPIKVNNVGNTTITNNSNSKGMFGNIGRKIKTLAQVVTWMGIIGSIVVGISMLSINDDFIFLGLLIMILGSFLSWVSSFVLYGFGQLVENSDKLVQLSKK